MSAPRPVLLIGCGALAREISWAITKGGWPNMELVCLPVDLHNRPQDIPGAMKARIRAAKETGKYSKILAVYGDCGTGGALDAVLAEEGAERIAGAHCYEFYTGSRAFAALNDEEAGSFYLTDYLVRFFDRLVIRGLGLDHYPHLKDEYFRNYKRVVYLAQSDDAALRKKARQAASRLGLDYVYRRTGLDGLESYLAAAAGAPPPEDEKDDLRQE